MSVRVVVAKYTEDVSWTSGLKHKVTIYDKSNSPIDGSIPLKNVGREAETFLRHIVNNYNNLDDVTVFVQGNPFEHMQRLVGWRLITLPSEKERVVEKINKEVHSESEFSSLYQVIYNVPNGTNGQNPRLFWKSYTGETYEQFTVSPGAQYVVPKQYILKRPIEFWKRLHNDMVVHDTLNAWCMEIMWYVAFVGRMNTDVKDHDFEKDKCMNGGYSFDNTVN